MYDDLIEELEDTFNSKFRIEETSNLMEIITDSKDLENNEKVMGELLEIATKYLTEKQLWDLGLSYDYKGEVI